MLSLFLRIACQLKLLTKNIINHKVHKEGTKFTKDKFMELENRLSNQIIGLALNVHKELGPGLLESSYKECLYHEIKESEIIVEKEKPLPLIYKKVNLEIGYRIDLLVDNKLVIEIKAVEALNDVHLAQVLTYLKLSKCRLGLLINFNVSLLKKGLQRVIL